MCSPEPRGCLVYSITLEWPACVLWDFMAQELDCPDKVSQHLQLHWWIVNQTHWTAVILCGNSLCSVDDFPTVKPLCDSELQGLLTLLDSGGVDWMLGLNCSPRHSSVRSLHRITISCYSTHLHVSVVAAHVISRISATKLKAEG